MTLKVIAPAPLAAGLSDLVLTSEQSRALDTLTAAIRERRYLPALLQGVTGSGKTNVLQGCVHLLLFAVFVLLIFAP